MLLNHTPDDIVNSWQRLSDRALEAGQTPLLIIGVSDGNLDTLAGLYAYEVFDACRPSGQPPQTLVGGAGPLWLLALLQIPNVKQHDLPSSEAGIAYTGTETGMAMAATTIYDLTSASPSRRRLMPPPGELDLGLQAQLLPASRLAQPVRWSAFPLAIAQERQESPRLVADGNRPIKSEPNWSAAAALLLAVALVMLAGLL